MMTKEELKKQHDKAAQEFMSFSRKFRGQTIGEMLGNMTAEERREYKRLLHKENELWKQLIELPW